MHVLAAFPPSQPSSHSPLSPLAHPLQSAEDKTRAELHELQSNTQAHQEAIERGASGVRHEDFVTFDSEHQLLLKEVRRISASRAREA